MVTKRPRPRFVSRKTLIMLADLAGFAKAFQKTDDIAMAEFIQDYYTFCEEIVTRKNGAIVKFIGDGVLCRFQPNAAKAALEAAIELQSMAVKLAKRFRLPVALGVNLHLAFAIDAEFGAGVSRRRDLIGRGVNQTFLLGRGAGIRISASVYRSLPRNARSPWNKHEPPAVYHMNAPEGILEGLGKPAVTNAARW